MVTVTGWTWDYCEDALTVPRLHALHQEWRNAPPVHELFAAFVGYEKPLTTEEKIAQGAFDPLQFAAFVKQTGGKLVSPREIQNV